MKVTGTKRWLILVLVSILAGFMVYVPFLRYNYLDQMTILFTQYKPVVEESYAYQFIGDIGFAFGIITMFCYLVGGIFADKFSERSLLLAGSVLMGAASIWYGTVPGKAALMLIHVLYALGTGVLIWSAYLKVTRKMGNKKEQGRMYSVSELVRAILGMLTGFMGVSFLGKAILQDSTTDVQVLGAQWRNLLFVCGFAFIILGVLTFFLLPKNIIGNEVSDEGGETEVQESISLKSIGKVLRMPGVWLISLLIFFCFSFTSAGAGYLGSYTVNVLGISSTQASSYAVVRNYIIAGVSTLAIGFIADKIGSKVKTLGIYLVIATVMTVVMLATESSAGLCIAMTFIFAAVYTGMRGVYFATLSEVGIPLSMTGVATGVISFLCYLPDVYFAKLAGYWIDTFGNTGYHYIWFWAIGCGVLGVVTAAVTTMYASRLAKRRE